MKFDGSSLRIWNALTQSFEEERVFGGGFVKFFYGNAVGRAVAPLFTHNTLISRAYGWSQSKAWSARKINAFVRDFKVPMDIFEGAPYTSFNEFFIRKFRPGVRPFAEPPHFAAPCEARYSLFSASTERLSLGVKGASLNPRQILGSDELARKFLGGPVAVARLCPVDYHRYHFNDDGVISDFKRIRGRLNSVNPMSLLKLSGVFSENERHVTVVKTKNFGEIAYVDVGAVCVGKIVQNKIVGDSFELGEERGYFLFGGSTVIIFGQEGAWQWNPDLLAKCHDGWEVWAPLGFSLGNKT